MSSNQNSAQAPGPMTFPLLVNGLRRGKVETELMEQVRQIVAACKRNGGKGSLTLQLNFVPHGSGNKEIYIHPKISTKLPANTDITEATTFYATDNGNLVTDDPDQGRLELDERREARRLEQLATAIGG